MQGKLIEMKGWCIAVMIITLTEMTRILQQRETCTFLEKCRFIGNVKQNSFNS